MKKALEDVKSFVTILFATTLVILLFIAVFKSETIFEMVFLLFTNLCTAVFTYFFARKKNAEEMPKVPEKVEMPETEEIV